MLLNYLKIAWRNIKRQKVYSTINIVGLAIGLTISLVIAFYVMDDITFDQFHDKPETVFRIAGQSNVADSDGRTTAITSGPLPKAAQQEFPEIIGATLITNFGNQPIARGDAEQFDPNDENTIRARALLTNPGFFDVFSFKIIHGDAADLAKPNAVFLTPDVAEAVFGDEDPVGQALQLRPVQDAYVAGIVEKPPGNSHIQFEMILPLRVEMNALWWDTWENQALTGYVRLHEAADPVEVAEKMDCMAHANGYPANYTVLLQPLLEIHLHSSNYSYDFRNFGKKDVSVIYVMTAIGIMILLIASINFINLSSARAAQRAREVGMRKVVGAERTQLMGQFLGESVFITFIAMVIAIFILQMTLPNLEDFLEKSLKVDFVANPMLLVVLLGVALGVGLASGIYPSFILSAFKPILVLRGEFQTSKSGVLLRRILVIFQFVITVGLIVGVLTVFAQIRHLQSMNLGYNRDQVLVMPNFIGDREDILRNKLEELPTVTSMGRTSRLMGEGLSIQAIPEGYDRSNSFNWFTFYIDDGFFKTLDIEMADGRLFSPEIATDATEGLIINQAAVDLVGWDNPVGRRIDLIQIEGNAEPRRVIGVVKDFHFTSTRRATGPLLFLYSRAQSPLLLARLAGGDIVETREQIDNLQRELFPDRPPRSFFLDDIFDNQFNDDREFASHLGFFAGVAIFIACLGLIGLVSFAVEQRRKEIAVRKVLGCSEGKVVFLLALDFLKWIAIGNFIAWPIAYLGMQRWIAGFVYRVPFTVIPILLAGILALVIAMLTISFQSIKAARLNPANALRQDM